MSSLRRWYGSIRSTLPAAAFFLVGVGLLGAGCGSDPLPPLPGADAGDCDANAAACGCSSDSQCGGATPRCDRNTGKCVRCLPAADNCPAGQRCVATNGTYACAGTCQADSDCPPTGGGAAAVCCGGACLDTSTDRQNCGGCGKACPTAPHATPGCFGGVCGVQCDLHYDNCDRDPANGCEVNIDMDPQNCSSCGAVCRPAGPNAMPACQSGLCATVCAAGFSDCNMNPGDGCEVNSDTDTLNCGACGRPCAGLPGASSACMKGVCAIVACNPGRTDCNKRPDDGCEADLTSDPLNCGACGVACPAVPNGGPGCKAGVCAVGSCNKGFGDCDGNANNGCEAVTTSDAKNCGACGMVCGGPNSIQGCANGACTITSCSQGFSDCDAMASNGCESPTANDVNNCGGCGKACAPFANGNVSCANSMCVFGGCKFGFADCNNESKDGCEANLLGPIDCGKCGNICPALPNANPGCNLAMCGVGTCKPGFGDCNKNPADGCEKPVDSDVQNCGACGKVCAFANAIPGCLANQCGILGCNAGYADCDGMAANGCEVYTNGDVKSCGKCGMACGNGLQCSGGQCVNLYQPVGPQTNVPIGSLAGWSQCFLDVYGDAMTPSLAQIQAMCGRAKLMLACRPTGAQTLQLLAWANRADVLFDTGNVYNSSTSHSANGSAWYYGSALSWGFARDGDPVNRGSCDTRASSLDATGGNGSLRLCWHTGGNNLNGGWRCGTNDTLNASMLFERIIYQAD